MKKTLRLKIIFENPTYSTWFYTGSRIFILLIITPLLITRYTTEEIALWYLISSVIAFSHLFDIGFSTTIIRFTAYAMAESEEKRFIKLENIYGNMNTIYLLLTFIALIFILANGFYSVVPLIEKNNISDGYLSFFYVVTLFPINFYLKRHDAFIKGMNYISLYNNWNGFLYIIGGSITISAILLHLKFNYIILSSQFTLLIISIKNIFLFQKITDNKVNLLTFSLKLREIHELWTPTWKSALISFSSNGMTQFTNIIAAKYLKVETAATYMFTYKLMSIINEFSWAPFYAKLPSFIKTFKERGTDAISNKILLKFSQSLLLLIIGLTFLIIIAPYIVTLIKSNVLFLSLNITILMMIMFTVERFIAMHSQIIMFSNNIEHYKFYITMSVIYIILLYLSIKSYGVFSIPVSYIFSASSIIIIITKRSLRLLNIKSSFYIRKYIMFYILSILMLIFILFLLNQII